METFKKQLPEVFYKTSLQFFKFVTLLKETPTQVFSVNVAKFLRTAILKNICERLFLIFVFHMFSGELKREHWEELG